MKRILEVIDKESFIQKHHLGVSKIIKPAIEKVYEGLTTSQKNQLRFWLKLHIVLKILLFFTIIGIFFLVSWYLKASHAIKKIRNGIDLVKIHEMMFIDLPIEAKVSDSLESFTLHKRNIYRLRIKMGVPHDAIIENETKNFLVNSQIGTLFYKTIVWKWTRRNNDTTQTFHVPITYCFYEIANLKRGYEELDFLIGTKSFNLFKLGSNFETESQFFNKKISVQTNDEQRMLMILTPYYMELILKINANIKNYIQKWSIKKSTKNMTLIYRPKDIDHLFLDFKKIKIKDYSTNLIDPITDGLTKDIVADFYHFYSTLEIMLMLNINKW